MARFQYVILSRSKPGREAEFERWYRERHLADVCRIDGVISGKLHKVDFQKVYELDVPQWTLMAIYELEGDDPQTIISAIVAVSGSDAMPLSPDLNKAGMIQAAGHLIASID